MDRRRALGRFGPVREPDTVAFWLLMAAALAALTVLVTMTVDVRPARAPFMAAPSAPPFGSPAPRVPALPPVAAPAGTPPPSTVAPAPVAPATVAPVRATRTRPPKPTARPARPRPSPPRAPWAAWLHRPIALEVAGRPGVLLGHRDGIARLTGRHRTGTTFVPRPGFAARACLSFESARRPGSYLRHRDFVLRLDGDDRSELFARDATFCPEAAPGGALALRSLNFPDRRLAAAGRSVVLAPVPAGDALHLRLRAPVPPAEQGSRPDSPRAREGHPDRPRTRQGRPAHRADRPEGRARAQERAA